jgi:hypothetical protein
MRHLIILKGIENIPANITNILPIKYINSTYVNCQEEKHIDVGAIFVL